MFRPPKREQAEVEKLNLIPIMDAVFILIFFLLFSAQFIKIYEIASDAPVISEVPMDEKLKKDPLNLIVKIKKNKILVTTGIDSKVYATVGLTETGYDYKKLKEIALELKVKHMDEKYAIVSPDLKIKYELIVQVMDAVQLLPGNKKMMDIEIKGKMVKMYKIFNQVVLEPNTE